MSTKLKVGFDAMTMTVGYVGINIDISHIAGDFSTYRPKVMTPGVIRRILELKDVERVVVYSQNPRVIEIIRENTLHPWSTILNKIYEILADELSSGEDFHKVDINDLFPEFVGRRAGMLAE